MINGQKTWSSGARFAEWGELIARTDFDVPKHEGLTAFMLAMDAPGVTVRPIRQMCGGSSFNEVFFTDVRIPDSQRLGEVGEGWIVALTTLGFERGSSGSGRGTSTVGGSFERLLGVARWLGRIGDPLMRQRLADVYAHERLREFVSPRALASAVADGPPGPYASIGKLLWTQSMTRIGDVAAELLGPRIIADTGEWGTFAWTKQILGAPGYRIAGGSDEIHARSSAAEFLACPPSRDPTRVWRSEMCRDDRLGDNQVGRSVTPWSGCDECRHVACRCAKAADQDEDRCRHDRVASTEDF